MSDIILPPITAVHTVPVGDVSIFYREAAIKYHVIAPDLPNFGFTTVPENFSYEAPVIAQLVGDFLDVIGIEKFAIYMTDYGVPVAMRLALTRPEYVTSIISQNGNMYQDGFSSYWDGIKALWNDPENKDIWTTIRDSISSREYVKRMYEIDAPNAPIVPPEAYWHDYSILEQPNRAGRVVDMLSDHRHNVAMYPQFQAFIRERKVPVLVLWGARDYVFVRAGAEAYKRDAPNAVIKFFDSGHFLLETHLEEAAREILFFLQQHI